VEKYAFRKISRTFTECGIPDKAAAKGLEAIADRLDIQMYWRLKRLICERKERST